MKNDLSELQAAAASALAEHERVLSLVRGYTHLTPPHRTNLIGKAPHWAHYVLSLGKPAANFIVTGDAADLRARALRMLMIADRLEPVGCLR